MVKFAKNAWFMCGIVGYIGLNKTINHSNKIIEDAIEKLKAGATLIQMYTGFIYEGPAVIKRINKAIIDYRKNK